MQDHDPYTVAADELRALLERVELLEEEKKEIAERIKEVYGEAKGRGYDVPTLRTLVSLRRKDKDQAAEAEAVLGLYKSALGMARPCPMPVKPT